MSLNLSLLVPAVNTNDASPSLVKVRLLACVALVYVVSSKGGREGDWGTKVEQVSLPSPSALVRWLRRRNILAIAYSRSRI